MISFQTFSLDENPVNPHYTFLFSFLSFFFLSKIPLVHNCTGTSRFSLLTGSLFIISCLCRLYFALFPLPRNHPHLRYVQTSSSILQFHGAFLCIPKVCTLCLSHLYYMTLFKNIFLFTLLLSTFEFEFLGVKTFIFYI